MLNIIDVSITTDLGNQTTTVGHSYQIVVTARENNWQGILDNHTDWNQLKTDYLNWQEIKDY